MKKLLLLLIIGSWIAPAFAKDQPVIDVFGCKVKPGKTIANFDTAANAWAAQADKLPDNKSYFAAILKPFRAKRSGTQRHCRLVGLERAVFVHERIGVDMLEQYQ